MTPARVREQERPDGRAVRRPDGRATAPPQRPRGPAARALALQRSAGNRAVGMLLRQPTTTQGAPATTRQPVVTRIDRDRARVVMPDGRRYEVTRVRVIVRATRRSV